MFFLEMVDLFCHYLCDFSGPIDCCGFILVAGWLIGWVGLFGWLGWVG